MLGLSINVVLACKNIGQPNKKCFKISRAISHRQDGSDTMKLDIPSHFSPTYPARHWQFPTELVITHDPPFRHSLLVQGVSIIQYNKLKYKQCLANPVHCKKLTFSRISTASPTD